MFSFYEERKAPAFEYINNENKKISMPLNMAFDNILRLLDLLEESSGSIFLPSQALEILTGRNLAGEFTLSEQVEAFSYLLNTYIKPEEEKPQLDLTGQPMKQKKKPQEKPLISVKQDAPAIFAAFLQAYNINLNEARGALTWGEFSALLANLPDGTKLGEIMKIRAWKPDAKTPAKERERMKKLQKIYKIEE